MKNACTCTEAEGEVSEDNVGTLRQGLNNNPRGKEKSQR